MNKTELIKAIETATGLKKVEIEKVLAAYVETVETALKNDEKVSYVGFGTFEAKKREARIGHNPMTGKEIEIAASVAPTFKAGKAFKDALNK